MKNSSLEEITLEVKDKVFNFLSLKPRTEKEISGRIDYYLKKYKDLDSDQKDDIKHELIEDLKRSNLIDDESYIKAFIKEKINSPKTTSKLKIKQFLKNKGIDDKGISEALEQFPDEQEEENMIKDARKKLATIKDASLAKKKSKLISYLASRGYPYQKIYTVVDSVLGVK